MGRKYFVRVAAVGTENDMRRLCQAMLRNAGWDEALPASIDGLTDALRRYASEEAGPKCEFIYEMITTRAYGDAEEDSCRFAIRQEPCGLWTALFAYESSSAFQPEDWLRLHIQCDRLPMLILRACDDFDREKGLLVLSGGYMQEEWSHMEECWLWLVTRYGDGDQEHAVRQLNRLARLLEDEEDELTVPDLLEDCGHFLGRLRANVADAGELRELLAQAVQNRDYQTLFQLQCRLAQAALWEADRAEHWQQCLESLLARFPAN